MTIASNIVSMMATHRMGETNQSMRETLQHLSSGLRIVSAADDAAGQGVATDLETTSISARQAMRNTNDAISILQTAEAAATEISDMVQRTHELFVASASETLNQDERDYLVDEYTQIRTEIDRIAGDLEFGGILLNNSSLDAQVGVYSGNDYEITLEIGDMTTSGLTLPGELRLQDQELARETLSGAVKSLDLATDALNEIRASIGATQNRLESSLSHNEAYTLALDQALSSIQDADFAVETSKMSKLQIMQQAGVASLAQAKNINQAVVGLLN